LREEEVHGVSDATVAIVPIVPSTVAVVCQPICSERLASIPTGRTPIIDSSVVIDKGASEEIGGRIVDITIPWKDAVVTGVTEN